MKTEKELLELTFYKGKYRTPRGLKQALIKEDIVWISKKRNYYLWDAFYEYYYDYEYFRDLCNNDGFITASEYKHFRKWLKEKIKTGEIKYINTRWYHCEENDGIGCIDYDECLECVRDGLSNPRDLDNYIETSEQSIDYFADTMTAEEFQEFLKLPEAVQLTKAMNWRIKTYKEWIKNNQ